MMSSSVAGGLEDGRLSASKGSSRYGRCGSGAPVTGEVAVCRGSNVGGYGARDEGGVKKR